MLRGWFDERFRAAGARSFHFSVVRMAMAVAIWTVLGLGVGWREAGLWAVAAVLAEWPFREVTRPMARGLSLSRAELAIGMAVYALDVAIWSAPGALLWASDHMACQVAGLAYFSGHLLYLNTHHGRSMGALVPALPALIAPALAPVLIPHFHGVDQVVVEITMLAVVAHAAMGVAVNFADARKPKAAAAPVQIPEVCAPAVDTPARAQPLWNGRPLRVLAAEDSAVNQLVLRTLLAQMDVEPVVVGDGLAAVEAWAQEPWDLILMDVQMPGMDGPSAARAIRAAEAQTGRAYTPIVALTADAAARRLSDYAEAGMDGHVAKPIEAASLFAALELARRPVPPATGVAGAAAA